MKQAEIQICWIQWYNCANWGKFWTVGASVLIKLKTPVSASKIKNGTAEIKLSWV